MSCIYVKSLFAAVERSQHVAADPLTGPGLVAWSVLVSFFAMFLAVDPQTDVSPVLTHIADYFLLMDF